MQVIMLTTLTRTTVALALAVQMASQRAGNRRGVIAIKTKDPPKIRSHPRSNSNVHRNSSSNGQINSDQISKDARNNHRSNNSTTITARNKTIKAVHKTNGQRSKRHDRHKVNSGPTNNDPSSSDRRPSDLTINDPTLNSSQSNHKNNNSRITTTTSSQISQTSNKIDQTISKLQIGSKTETKIKTKIIRLAETTKVVITTETTIIIKHLSLPMLTSVTRAPITVIIMPSALTRMAVSDACATKVIPAMASRAPFPMSTSAPPVPIHAPPTPPARIQWAHSRATVTRATPVMGTNVPRTTRTSAPRANTIVMSMPSVLTKTGDSSAAATVVTRVMVSRVLQIITTPDQLARPPRHRTHVRQIHARLTPRATVVAHTLASRARAATGTLGMVWAQWVAMTRMSASPVAITVKAPRLAST
jgi:hypothetical protein